MANRSQLYDMLARALERASRAGRITAVVVADMNGFKRINDTLGHKAGDQALVAFGGVLHRGVLGSDFVARLGGDEFAIVLRDIGTVGNAETVLWRILADLAEPVVVGGRKVLRASFGVALSRPGEVDADNLIHRADVAMYQAKRDKNVDWACYAPGMEAIRILSFDDGLHEEADKRFRLKRRHEGWR